MGGVSLGLLNLLVLIMAATGVFLGGAGGAACFWRIWRIGVFLLAGSSSSWLALDGVNPGILNFLPGLVFLVGGEVFLTVVRVLLDGMAGV